MPQSHKTAAVVGAGIAGIASAIRLANKGYQVKVFETNAYPGGKLSEISGEGYRFDAGPSLFTMPHFIDELFELSGKDPRAYFNYSPLDIVCKYFYEDGTILRAFSDSQKFAQEAAQYTQDDPQTILNFLKKSQEKYELTSEVFLHNSLHRLRNYFTKSTLKGILNFHRLDVFSSMNRVNEKTFQDPKLVQLFNRYATYNGSDPYQTPGIMNIIPHLEFGIGAFFPHRGMYSITQSLVKLAQDLGVYFQFNTRVKEIKVNQGQVKGLVLCQEAGDLEEEVFDKVVSNVDIVSTYRHLLPAHKAPKRLLNQPKSSSALIFYWGMQKEFPSLELHNIFFSKNYKEEFTYLFKNRQVYTDPTIYINISSKENPQDAPPNCENWFTMINAPNNVGQDWEQFIQESRENIIQKLERVLKTDIRPYIRFESILDPRTIESRTSSSLGALYGNSSNNRFAAFLRHANFSSKIKNLYFCGGSVHPGGGIPLCLLSAKIATSFVDRAN